MGPRAVTGRLNVHEMSVALEVCRVAEEQVGRERLADVLTVAVEVGDYAGLEIRSFEFCLETLLASPPFGRARPLIERSRGDELRVCYLEVDDGDQDDRGAREGDGPQR